MAAFALRAKARYAPANEPNVIPFIDVLLVLLIIFMVTAPIPTTDLKLDMPRPGGTPPQIAPTIVEIRPAPGGFSLFLESEEIPFSELERRTLAHLLAKNPELTPRVAYAEAAIYVRADLDVAYQHVVALIEKLQLAHFRKVGILAQRADAASGVQL